MFRKANEPRGARRWPRLALVGAVTTVTGVAAFAGVSGAHTPNAVPGCTGLAVTLGWYEGDATNNRVVVTVDGTPHTFTFGTDFATTIPWSATKAHTWSIDLDANLHNGDNSWDWSTSGTQQACETPETTVPETTVPETTVPETTVPETTVPETTVPETTVPETTVPERTVPETTAPRTTAPATTAVPTTVDVCAVSPSEAICSPAVVEAQQQPESPAVVDAAPAVVDPTTTTSIDLSTATLPETGSNTGIQLAVGLTVLSAGTALVVFARRRRQPSPDA